MQTWCVSKLNLPNIKELNERVKVTIIFATLNKLEKTNL